MTVAPALIASISGLPKTGKTHLALTWPPPILVFSFDLGFELVVKKFEGKQIEVMSYPIPIIDSDPPKPYAKQIWEKFNADYLAALAGGKYNTIVLDTATAVWEIIRHAVAEEKGQQKLLEVQYTLPNLRMNSLFTRAITSGINFVTTQHLKDRYVKGENTGELELDGWKRTKGQVDLFLKTERKTVALAGGKRQNIILTTIEDNRYELALNGTELTNTTYKELLAMVVGG